jgi:hypothetical protein
MTNRSKVLGILGGGLAVTAAAATLSSGAPPAAAGANEAIARGAQIVVVGGCNHCHTPWAFEPKLGMPVPNMKRMLSGHPADAPDPEGKRGKSDIVLIGPTFTSFAMPFGIVYAPNLTPDKDTGLGTWTEKMFVDAMKTGKHLGGNGRAILPPMPWMDLGQLPESDLKALFAYLRSLPAVRNAVPGHKVPDAAYTAVTESFEKLKKAMRERHATHP